MRWGVPPDDRSVVGELIRLFMRRLLDNDAMSPHADRHDSVAVLLATVVSIALFVTFFLCVNYLATFVLLPGPAALSALSDRFLFITGSLTISALATLATWDALALEPRDVAILGPLPIASSTITRAKLTAILISGSIVTVLLNAAPSVLYPALLTLNIRGIRGAALLQLMAVHFLSTVLAGLVGFFGALALRGTVRTFIGSRVFHRVSSGVQSAAIVSMTTALLLAPTVRAADVREWVARGSAPVWPVDAALWYLGLNESGAGYLLADTPIALPSRLSGIPTDTNEPARAAYRALRPRFEALATRAWLSLPIVVAIALCSFLWTNRRLPEHSGDVSAGSPIRAGVRRFFERHIQQDPEVEAGFFFTLQTLTRSAPHRTILAVSLAVGATHAFIAVFRGSVAEASTTTNTAGILAISTGFLLSVLTGVRHAVTVPGAPAANWTFRMAWQGDERRYLIGAKRAAVTIAIFTLLLLLPFHLALLGSRVAIGHTVYGALFAVMFVDASFLGYRKLPFACGYLPIENPRIVWPLGLAGLLIVANGFSGLERWALEEAVRAAGFAVALGTIALVLERVDQFYRSERTAVVFDERPAPPTQRLGLYEHVMGTD